MGMDEQRLDVSETATREVLSRRELLGNIAGAGVALGSASLLRIPAAFAASPQQKTETISPKTWLDVDEENNVIETESLKIGYGPYYWHSIPPPYLPSYSIVQMVWKEKRVGLVGILDGWEYGPALNLSKKPQIFRKTKETKDYIEVRVEMQDSGTEWEGFNNPNRKMKTAFLKKWDRVYKKTPVLEIEYEQSPFVDFTDIVMPGDDPCSFALSAYGTKRDLPDAKFKEIAAAATALPDHTGLEGHFIKYFFDYAGADMNACVYKKHQIWGIRDEKTNIGIGFVTPAVREWETWVNGGGINYYCYQFYRASKEAFPKQFKRWIFAFQGNRENCFAMGTEIVDNGGPLS